ncbi:hypothetical protein CN213_15910 [Sinorhizobium meliloti]|uniref:hypothetical protein n=1 Tax=Rhizobium meliloti TaxID=382 RepID=UPI000FD84DEF|nr:hypothetical protein [Sinorhizobium meliloti]RVH56231.1 hypothetical protein CN213_15910 [Sinorhizobium meliloti]
MSAAALSTRAKKLFERVKAGEWYPWTGPGSGPKAMQELVDAELVTVCGRNEMVRACYVPVGYIMGKDMMPPDDGGQPFASRLYRTPYLVIPRLALEAMPLDWQRRFEALLREADDAGLDTPEYHVFVDHPARTLVERADPDDPHSEIESVTRILPDPWANYRRGRIEEVCPTFKNGGA